MTMKGNILKQKLKIVNVGIESFAEDLKNQGVEVVHVDWRPPAGGDLEMLRLLERLDSGSTRTSDRPVAPKRRTAPGRRSTRRK